MIVRNAVAGDAPAITNIVESLWAGDELWGPSRTSRYEIGGRSTVLVAQADGAVVGVASLLPSQGNRFGLLHIDVAPHRQRQGAGRALLNKIRSLHEAMPMMIRVRPRDAKTSRFLEHHEFSIAERVIEGWVDPSSPVVRRWTAEAQDRVPSSVSIQPMAFAKYSHRDIASVIDSWYRRHHRWAPTRDLTIDEALAIYVDPALPDTGHVAEVDGKLVGAGVLLPDPFQMRPDGAHLVYLGVGDSGRPDEAAIVSGLFAACMGVANAQGRTVQVEVSDLHTPAWELLKSLPAPDIHVGLVVYVG